MLRLVSGASSFTKGTAQHKAHRSKRDQPTSAKLKKKGGNAAPLTQVGVLSLAGLGSIVLRWLSGFTAHLPVVCARDILLGCVCHVPSLGFGLLHG